MPIRHSPLAALAVFILLATTAGHAAERPLHIGIFPRHAEHTIQRMFTPIADYLSERLGRPVRLLSAPDFPAFWGLIKQGRLDLVHYNQYHYLKAHRLFGHRVILKNEEGGRDNIRAIILVRADSPAARVTDLKDGKILFGGGRGAMVSYIMARDILREQGLKSGDYLEAFSNTPVGAARDMFFGQGDAAGIDDSILHIDDTPWKRLGMPAPQALLESRPIAHLPWAVTSEVDEKLAGRLTHALLQLNETAAGRQLLHQANLTGLRPATDREYDPARVIVSRVLGEQY